MASITEQTQDGIYHAFWNKYKQYMSNNHGGKRPNSGTKKTKGKRITFRLAQDVQDTLEKVVEGQRANTKTEAVEEAVRGHWKRNDDTRRTGT